MLKCNYKNLNNMFKEMGVITEKTAKGIAFTFYVNDKHTLENKRCGYYIVKTGDIVITNVFGENTVANNTQNIEVVKQIVNDVRRNG